MRKISDKRWLENFYIARDEILSIIEAGSADNKTKDALSMMLVTLEKEVSRREDGVWNAANIRMDRRGYYTVQLMRVSRDEAVKFGLRVMNFGTRDKAVEYLRGTHGITNIVGRK